MFEYNAITTRIFDIYPYLFFAIVGVVFSASLFILLLLKYDYNIPRYTKIFLTSSIGALIGARIFGFLTGLYIALANKDVITLETFLNTGIVFWGGLIGFVATFLWCCKMWEKEIEYKVVELVTICIPLFHFWARIGCFLGGCCYGVETDSWFSVLYTTRIQDVSVTAYRIPIQLVESGLNLILFSALLILLYKKLFEKHLLKVYLLSYAGMRIVLEIFRGDAGRGIWGGVSFSQIVSVIVIVCTLILWINLRRARVNRQ